MSSKSQNVCEDMQRMIPAFVAGTLSDEELKGFLKHVGSCKECQQELMTYDILEYGLKEKEDNPCLDDKAEKMAHDYNFQRLMMTQLKDMYQALSRKKHMEHLAALALFTADVIASGAAVVMLLLRW